MTDSISPLDDTQTFVAPIAIDPVTGNPVYPGDTINAGTWIMVPSADGTGCIVNLEVNNVCMLSLNIPEEAVKRFQEQRRAMFAKRILSSKPSDIGRFKTRHVR
jgi:hypothetical protein